MKMEPSCIPCIMKQAYNTASRASTDSAVIRLILNRTADYVKTIDLNSTPADASNFVYEITSEITGVADPFADEKRKYNEICRSMLPKIERIINESGDKFRVAARTAILGNIVDLGIGLSFDLLRESEKIFNMPFVADDTDELKEMVGRKGRKILYIGDNAGEIVFDRLFVERIMEGNDVVFVVKRGPIINDATLEDAVFAGLSDIVKVIDTGSNGIGVKWSAVSEEFLMSYKEADIIISKGQGNFETLNDRPGTKFFLLRAKCESVARELGVSCGDIVLKKRVKSENF